LGAGIAVEMAASAIVDGWETALRPFEAVHHQAGNHLATIDGDRATAFCYGIAIHYLPNLTGRNTRTFVGSYDFELQKQDGAWRITAFRFNLKYREGNLELGSAG